MEIIDSNLQDQVNAFDEANQKYYSVNEDRNTLNMLSVDSKSDSKFRLKNN